MNNNKVIGGEFSISQDVLLNSNINVKNVNSYTQDKYFYSSGRCALYAILNDISIDNKDMEVLIPNYLCESIIKIVEDLGFESDFYHIGNDFRIDFSSLHFKSDKKTILLLIDYFGMVDLSTDIKKIRELYPELLIIADCVQAFFSLNDYDADYCFTSIRKWFACPDGALVAKKKSESIHNIDLSDGIWWKYKYAGNILKEYPEIIDDNIILNLLDRGEKYLDKNYLCNWNEISKKVFLQLDLENIRRVRKKNAEYLHENLKDLNVKHLYMKDRIPLFIPILIEQRDELRKLFFEKNIFTPVHWPNKYNIANNLYDMELSLICDQRYTLEEMEKQIDVIKKII